MYKGGSRASQSRAGPGVLGEALSLPLGTVMLPAPGLLQALKGARQGWRVLVGAGRSLWAGSSPRWPTLLLSTTRLSRERVPWLWAEGLKDSAQLVKPVRGAREQCPSSVLSAGPCGLSADACGLGRQWWRTLVCSGTQEPRLGSSLPLEVQPP